MIDKLKGFWREEDGAVTVDWVVLTASIVGLGLAAILIMAQGTTQASNSLGNSIEDITVASY
ncbi:MAG: hypothetical protein AAFQ66_10310 [Pseudomonadota bacterium]